MLTLSTVVIFIATSIVLIIAPGPDILFVLTQGISNGKRAGVITALGLACGNLVHTTAAALGITLLLKTSLIAFTVLKVFGVCYLAFLAYKAIKYRNEPININNKSVESGAKLFSKGFLMNVLNPKVALFFVAYLPQFITSGKISSSIQIIFYGMLFTILVIPIFGAVGYFSGFIGNWLMAKKKFSYYMNLVSASVFMALGIKLALTKR